MLGYGCLGGLLDTLRGWFANTSLAEPLTEPQPLIGDIDPAKLIVLGTLAAGGIALYQILNRPKVADMLIDTEAEMKKVTWPTSAETFSGAVAVMITVGVMLGFLYFSDYALTWLLTSLMLPGGTAA